MCSATLRSIRSCNVERIRTFRMSPSDIQTPPHRIAFSAVVLLIFFIVQNVHAADAEFPATIVQRCSFGDSKCLRNLIQTLFDKHLDGVPELGLQPLSPLHIDRMTINQGQTQSGPVTVNIAMRDMKLYGWDRLKVERVIGFEKDPRTSKFRIDATVPMEQLIGKYSLKGQMLVLPLSGKGASNITFENVQMNVTLRTTVEERNGNDYLKLTGVRASVDATRMLMNFDNLLNDASLSASVNQMLNENSHLLMDEMRSSIGRSFERPLEQLIAPVFDAFPYRELFRSDGVGDGDR